MRNYQFLLATGTKYLRCVRSVLLWVPWCSAVIADKNRGRSRLRRFSNFVRNGLIDPGSHFARDCGAIDEEVPNHRGFFGETGCLSNLPDEPEAIGGTWMRIIF